MQIYFTPIRCSNDVQELLQFSINKIDSRCIYVYPLGPVIYKKIFIKKKNIKYKFSFPKKKIFNLILQHILISLYLPYYIIMIYIVRRRLTFKCPEIELDNVTFLMRYACILTYNKNYAYSNNIIFYILLYA